MYLCLVNVIVGIKYKQSILMYTSTDVQVHMHHYGDGTVTCIAKMVQI